MTTHEAAQVIAGDGPIRANGGGGGVCCPVHDDRDPLLDVDPGRGTGAWPPSGCSHPRSPAVGRSPSIRDRFPAVTESPAPTVRPRGELVNIASRRQMQKIPALVGLS